MNDIEKISLSLEHIDKNLNSITECLQLLCFVEYALLKRQNLEIKINDEDFLRSVKKCKS